jgi:hypothetical protein
MNEPVFSSLLTAERELSCVLPQIWHVDRRDIHADIQSILARLSRELDNAYRQQLIANYT